MKEDFQGKANPGGPSSTSSRSTSLTPWSLNPVFVHWSLPHIGLMTVTIRGEAHSVPLALSRSLGHTCYHIGQIVQLARFHAGDQWNTLTIPRGQSEQFNKANWGGKGKSHS